MKPEHCPLLPWARAAAALLFALSCSAVAQSAVQRCEGKDGSVTYSNTQCPSGTKPVRSVNTDPPVSVEERRAAQERAQKDGSAVKQVEKAREKEQARDQKLEAEQAKAQARQDAKAAERCEQARRDLGRAKSTRAELTDRSAATLERIEKADREITKREAEVASECKN